jgi:hypothetical protein
MDSAIPEADGTLATTQRTKDILARHAKADNTRRAYIAPTCAPGAPGAAGTAGRPTPPSSPPSATGRTAKNR